MILWTLNEPAMNKDNRPDLSKDSSVDKGKVKNLFVRWFAFNVIQLLGAMVISISTLSCELIKFYSSCSRATG